MWTVRGCISLREDLIDLCEKDLSVAHMLVPANARLDEANSYAALQSSDALMVELWTGNAKKQNNGHFLNGVLSMNLLSFVRGSVGSMRLGGLSGLLHS